MNGLVNIAMLLVNMTNLFSQKTSISILIIQDGFHLSNGNPTSDFWEMFDSGSINSFLVFPVIEDDCFEQIPAFVDVFPKENLHLFLTSNTLLVIWYGNQNHCHETQFKSNGPSILLFPHDLNIFSGNGSSRATKSICGFTLKRLALSKKTFIFLVKAWNHPSTEKIGTSENKHLSLLIEVHLGSSPSMGTWAWEQGKPTNRLMGFWWLGPGGLGFESGYP